MKKQFTIIACLVLILVVSPIIVKGVYHRMQIIVDPEAAALDYINKKYGEEFTMLFYGDNTMNSSSHNMYVAPVSHPDWHVYIRQDKTTLKYSDNYVAIFHQDDIEAWYQTLSNSVYTSSKIFLKVSTVSCADDLGLDSPIEDIALSEPIHFTLFTSDAIDDCSQSLSKFIKYFRDAKAEINFSVLYMTSELLSQATYNNFRDYSENGTYILRASIYSFMYDNDTFKWEEGEIPRPI